MLKQQTIVYHFHSLFTFDPRFTELSIVDRALSHYVLLEEGHQEFAANLLLQ